jgi:hypothetical protein
VAEHVAVQWVEVGVVPLGAQDAFLEELRCAAETAEGFLVQLGQMRELDWKVSRRTALRL